jgi:hypothetical protein
MFSVARWLGTNSGLVVLQIFFADFFFMYHPASDGYPTWLNLFFLFLRGRHQQSDGFLVQEMVDQQGCRSHIRWSVRWYHWYLSTLCKACAKICRDVLT